MFERPRDEGRAIITASNGSPTPLLAREQPVSPRSARPRAVLGVVAAGTLLSAMSGSTVNLALPDLGRDLDVALSTSRWVIQAFLLAIALTLPLAGRAGDRWGHCRVYLTGFGTFAVLSLACGLAGSFGLLAASRALQGMGAAMVMATGPALLTTTFPPEKRGQALGMLSTATYTGLTIGPTVGGLIVAAGGWRWTFLVNVAAGLVVLALGLRFLPRDACRLAEPAPRPRLSAAFLDWSLFRSPLFAGAALSALANYIALFVMILLVPFYLLEGLGRSSSLAGLLLSVQPLAMAFVAAPSGWLSDKIGTRGLAVGGLLLQALGLALLARLGAGASNLAVAGCLGLVGLGTGIFISPNSSALMGAAPRTRQGAAGSVLAEARIIGMFLGVALGTTLFGLAGGETGAPWTEAEFDALHTAIGTAVWVAVAGAVVAALRGDRRAGSP